MWWYDLLAIFSLQAIALLDACPTKCQCIGQARVSVYCDFRGLEEVPSNIPVATTYLDFSGNKFTKVVPEMFLGHANDSDGVFFAQKVPLEQLEVILQHGRRLDLNPLDTVSEHALDTTPSLEFM
ncbi:putative leucine-rich repeat domain-containing protein [Plasmopara halstedii]